MAKSKEANFPIIMLHCADKQETLNVIEQLLDQDKQFSVIRDDPKGWCVSYSTGPRK